MEAREELASTARRGFGASLLLALLAAALVTRSLRVALAATVCVAASALLFLGLQVTARDRERLGGTAWSGRLVGGAEAGGWG